MRLYNTLTRQIDDIIPYTPGQIGMYACGFTVYDFTHLGHLRKYTMDDVLLRMLRHEGLEVTFVENVTDVGHLTSDSDTGEDKLEKGARKYKKTPWEVAKEFEAYFWRSMAAMGNHKPDVISRATEHIPQQLSLVQQLEAKGFTYVIEGDGVYFDTSKLDDYGKLAQIDIEQLKEGARIERIPGKKNATDFALWKFERPGENRAMVWPSPWAERSFPGWHVECSAMAMEYLGEQFEIHTGGIDHINVHHTNEIAQSEAATDKKPFVKYWVHHNFLRVDGEKMSKSLGNFYTIDDVEKKGFSPAALRLLFLTSHYRSELNFTWQNLEGLQKTYDKFVRQLLSFKQETDRTVLSPEKLAQIEEYSQRFYSLLSDDLKTPEAITILWEVAKSNLPGMDKYDLIIDFDEILGLQLAKAVDAATSENAATAPAEILSLLAERDAARAAQDWAKADQVRDELAISGYKILDTAEGSVVEKS
ncbi:MAG: cysteine--tRNA ligase [bacterium]|nr:cysteine--tRNA ligase [bacterium]